MPAEDTMAEIPNLTEGKEYEFRVVPVNEAGEGEASEATTPIVTKARRGGPPSPSSLHYIEEEGFLLFNLYLRQDTHTTYPCHTTRNVYNHNKHGNSVYI